MRAIVVVRPGGPEVLEIVERPTPKPATGEVRVRVGAFGVNRADLLQRRGQYPAPPGAPADIPGLEYAGEIDAIGRGVTGQAKGTKVMGIVAGGAYAEYVIVPAAHLVPVPASESLTHAAAIPEAFITAFDALERAAVVAGEWVLIHAVASGVGTAALQLVNARGAHAIGTSRTATKLEHMKPLGLEHGIHTGPGTDFVAAVRQITGNGVQAALDLIGGAGFLQTLDAMTLKGRVVLIGLTAGSKAEVDLGLVLRKRLRIEGTMLRSRSADEKSQLTATFREAVMPLFAEGRVRPVVDRVFPFAEVAEAHAYVERNESLGKVVVLV